MRPDAPPAPAHDRPEGAVPPDVDAFLRENTRAFLLTRRRDGTPTAHPMLALYGDDAVLRFSTYGTSAKVRNVERDDRVACLVTATPGDPAGRAVLLRGRARINRSPDALGGSGGNGTAAGSEAAEREVPAGVAGTAQQRLREGKRVVLEIVAEHAAFVGT